MFIKIVTPNHTDVLKACSFLTSKDCPCIILGTAVVTFCKDCNVIAKALCKSRGYTDTPTFYDESLFNRTEFRHMLFTR